ncbi:heat-inducible transcriptional repressor HrcA, partial [Mycobacterium sp. ITM-2017-0098]
DGELAQLRDLLGQALEGKPLTTASVAVSDLAQHLNGQGGLADRPTASATVLVETLVEHTEERLLLGGTANLTRNTADFGGSLRSVLEA